MRIAVQQCTAQEQAAIANLPQSVRLADAPDLLIVHASARSDRENLPPYTPDEQIAEMFRGVKERWIVRGHDHIARTHPWRDKMIITIGSAGLPIDGNPAAQYALFDKTPQGWHVAHQAVAYALEATLARFAVTQYVEKTGVMGRLFLREVATATPHFVPFLRLYQQWSAQASLSLQDGLNRYLTYY